MNGGKHKTIRANASGQAIVYLTFTTNVNSLTVEGIGSDGVAGYANYLNIYAQGAVAAKVNDSNGDGVPDLLAIGDPSGAGSGIWLANGLLTGRVAVPALTVGVNGPDGDEVIDIANAFHSAPDSTVSVPDLLGITGSDADGYHLTYFVSPGWPLITTPEFTGTLTPTGGTDWQDWQDWQLFSTQTTTGVNLYPWQGVNFADNGDGTGSLSYAQYHVAKNWNVGASFTTSRRPTSSVTGSRTSGP